MSKRISRDSYIHPANLVSGHLGRLELARAKLDAQIKHLRREYDRWDRYEFPDQAQPEVEA